MTNAESDSLQRELMNARAGCVALGGWFLVSGGLLTFLGLFVVFVLGISDTRATLAPTSWLEFLRRPEQPMAIGIVSALSTFVLGMAFVASGISLRHERPRGATAALLSTAMAGIVYSGLLVWCVVNSRIFAGILAGMMLLFAVTMFLLSCGCRATFRQHPPPPGQELISNDKLEEMLQSRRRRMEH